MIISAAPNNPKIFPISFLSLFKYFLSNLTLLSPNFETSSASSSESRPKAALQLISKQCKKLPTSSSSSTSSTSDVPPISSPAHNPAGDIHFTLQLNEPSSFILKSKLNTLAFTVPLHPACCLPFHPKSNSISEPTLKKFSSAEFKSFIV